VLLENLKLIRQVHFVLFNVESSYWVKTIQKLLAPAE